MKKVLVTGGSGFIGKRLKKYRPEWVYVSSKDYDLSNSEECKKMYAHYSPDAVVHLAGCVGGIKDNTDRQAEFYYNNIMINTNVVHQAYAAGVERVLSSLSTCCFPDKVDKYPFCEKDLFSGPPAMSNLSYAFAKRGLYVQSKSYREQYGVNYSCFCPSNVYGPSDNFSDDSSHFVPALIKKVSNVSPAGTVELWGDGTAMRQQLYVDDLVQIIPVLLENHNTDEPLIVSPNENLTIDEMAKCLIEQVDKDIKIVYNNFLPGQHRKDGSNKELLKKIDDFKFTPFKEGIKKTYEWYNEK